MGFRKKFESRKLSKPSDVSILSNSILKNKKIKTAFPLGVHGKKMRLCLAPGYCKRKWSFNTERSLCSTQRLTSSITNPESNRCEKCHWKENIREQDASPQKNAQWITSDRQTSVIISWDLKYAFRFELTLKLDHKTKRESRVTK